ncbi:hypothetical protein E6P09_01965 [Haloferax mediterranei ATCC 33500]|uniref:Uncharacterized protein n=1 Tax=Haloferax mediterranei (strain ATCC 33500 / DSM 1411 / JCM 8866 / NBRC 14739 / NCIMB 2177 / R-4) TaxID=523841 RepID=M0ITB0_HALMT|nr:hypothetical protein [Haloferax mediterranei]AHZ23030.1 hypothetical protein BM92_10450 [Haloferax mediterranei ATCC 33500]ELZ99960.1 hypothetical protein C439_11513 [Haloferax mediterranei ATCC 33500]MDX5987618.1 hypothetical protein [Haloferax mediterranei ATCC 33500]QCQ74105.1 hypothetical protein E6P09_01965 [Haloferax mediterranei ATCC 33500]
MRLVTVETVTLMVVGWVLALGAIFLRHRRGEFDRRTGLNWVLVACFSIGWALWQYDTLPATADTPIGTLAPWVATLLGFVGVGVAVYLYRTRPDASGETASSSSEQS